MPGREAELLRRAAPLAAFAILAALSLAVSWLLTSPLPAPIEVFGGDGKSYAAMAEDPFEAAAPPPYAQRIAVPWLVAALPLDTLDGFMVIAVVGMAVASIFVGLIAREFGLEFPAQAAAAALTAGSYIGVHAMQNPYYVDPALLAVTAAAIWLGLRRRFALVAALLVVGVAVKEVAATLVVLPYLLDPRRTSLLDARSAARALAYAVPALAAFFAINLFAPAESAGDDLRLSFHEMEILGRGLVVSALNPLVALFGATILLWPLGLLRGPADLRRLHVWAVLATPILAFGHWERTLGVFVPLVVVAALLVLRRASPAVTIAFAAGSYWITGIAGAITVGEGETEFATKAGLVLPGLLVTLAALAVHARRVQAAR